MEKTSAYILSIVGIVGVVAIAVLMLNGVSSETTDLTGMAMGDPSCVDSDGGRAYTTVGTISGGTWLTTGKTYSDKTDSCNGRGKLQEYFFSSATQGFYSAVDCATVVGTGYTCSSGVCVTSTTTSSYPDLVIDSSATTASVSGEAIVSSSGTVLDEGTVRASMVGAIKNQGTATASGSSLSTFYLYYGSSSLTSYTGTKTLNIAAGSTDTTSYTTSNAYMYPATGAISLLQALYDSGSAAVTVQYTLDSSTRSGRYITESDETNNAGTVSVTLSSSSVTFTEAECTEHADCASGCGCFDYMCYVLASNSTSTEYWSSGVDC